MQPAGCKISCSLISDLIVPEIKVRQPWALRQHSCKSHFTLSLHFTARQLECGDAAPGCHHGEL